MKSQDKIITIHVDKGYCQFKEEPDRWHWCKLSKEQTKTIMDILKNAEAERLNEENKE